MKAIKLLKILPLILLFISVISCNQDDGLEPVPLVPVYETTFNVTLGYTYKVTDTNTGQVLVDINYGVEDVSTLLYVIHSKSDGSYVKMVKITDPSIIKEATTDNVTTLTDALPEGDYYITFVAFKDFAVEGVNVRTLLRPLTQNYDEAIIQVPNDYIHYATAEVSISVNEEFNQPLLMVLKKMTTDLIFEFAEAGEIPNPSAYRLTVGVKNIPSAFFVATGETLTANETEEKDLCFYSGERDVDLLTNDGQSAVVTIFHSLSNDQLPVSDRGSYWFEFKESADGGDTIKAVSKELDRFSPDYSTSMYIYGLSDEE